MDIPATHTQEKAMTREAAARQGRIYYAYGADIKETRPYPPCRFACPVHTDVQEYIALISQGRYKEAFEVIQSVNPIPSACSLICHHPCEQECRRAQVDEPLAIRHLKRFAVEKAAVYRREKRGPVERTRKERIAVIGSGPSGLAAASDLADLGYGVTIFERYPELGGMLSSAIPTYRLPREALEEDIQDVLAKGVEVRTSCEVGKEVQLAQLISDYDAVLIAVGLSESRSLPIPGVEGPGVLLALPFLYGVSHGRSPELGERVLVIGGGNVAIDVARSARRLGRTKIEMVCLESAQEMPAWEWEVKEALEEGIKITHRWGPKAVRRENGKVKGLEVVRVKAVFDEAGRFNPTFYEDQTSFIEADTIIITIGQKADLSLLRDSPLELDASGRPVWDKDTQMSSTKGVFFSGEVVTGPGAAIQAVASGHRAARAIHLYLQGEDVKAALKAEERGKIAALPREVAEKIVAQPREEIELLSPETRCLGFTQFEVGYDEMAALREARRCRSCGAGAIVSPERCSACLTCVRVCPYGAPVVDGKAQMLAERCQACGLCAPECPGRAIRMIAYHVDELRRNIPGLLGELDPEREDPILLAFLCNFHALADGDGVPQNVRQIRVHCVSRIDVSDLLEAFACGADGVFVVLCRDGECRYKEVASRVKGRIRQARELLAPLGVDGRRIAYFEADSHPEEVWRLAAQEMTETVKGLGIRAGSPRVKGS